MTAFDSAALFPLHHWLFCSIHKLEWNWHSSGCQLQDLFNLKFKRTFWKVNKC